MFVKAKFVKKTQKGLIKLLNCRTYYTSMATESIWHKDNIEIVQRRR